ncbi:MAG: EamA family transporter [Brachybacterium sp.]|nr:EamA family transporter [Brachybacterium sp.]
MIGILIAALLWGTTGTAATLLPPGVGPVAIGASTMLIGGIGLVLTAWGPTVSVLRDRTARRILLPGALATAVYPLAFYAAMSEAGVAVGNVVALGTAPLFAALLERVVEPAATRPSFTPRWGISAALAILGVTLLALFGHGSEGEDAGSVARDTGSLILGITLALLAGLSYAGYTVTAGRLMREGHSSRGVMAAQFGLAGVVLLPVLALTIGPALTVTTYAPDSPLGTLVTGTLGPLPPLVPLLYLALGPMMLAYLAFGRGLRTVPGSRATTITLLEPFTATVLAIVAVGERLGPMGFLGLGIVLAGVVLAATERGSPGRPTRQR